MNTFGNSFQITIFGESHGPCIGCTLDGLPFGFSPDWELVRFELSRRAPSGRPECTARHETDAFKILSGLYNDTFTGTPLTAIFENKDVKIETYKERIARPSHADLTAYVKYGGCNDPGGGGMFSGRLTAPLVFAGALAKQLLIKHGIHIISHVLRIGQASDTPFDPMMNQETIPFLDSMFPLIDKAKRSDFDDRINDAKALGTSLGGIVECAVLGVRIGLGEPFFDSIESMLSHLLFSIPAVHGVEFGLGFGFAEADGISVNDRPLQSGMTETNFSGGINGGITNGMPIIFRTCFRPIPTVRAEQTALDLETGEEVCFRGSERNDICILPRGCVIVECAAAIVIYDLLKRSML